MTQNRIWVPAFERTLVVLTLAIADGLVPPGVGQQDPLQHHLVGLRVLPAEEAATCPVKILKPGPRPV